MFMFSNAEQVSSAYPIAGENRKGNESLFSAKAIAAPQKRSVSKDKEQYFL